MNNDGSAKDPEETARPAVPSGHAMRSPLLSVPVRQRLDAARRRGIALVLGLAAASIAWRAIANVGAEESAAFFIGIPTLLAIVVILSDRSTSPSGSVFRALTLGLLLAGIVAGEAFVCIVMAAPLCYLVATPVAVAANRRHARNAHRGLRASLLLPLLVLSAEGIVAIDTFPLDDHVTAHATIVGAPADVQSAIAATPAFDRELPWLLDNARFPRPVAAIGSGLAVGDERLITFVMPGQPVSRLPSGVVGPTMLLQIIESAPGRIVFAVRSDDTPIAGWMALERATVTWAAVDDDHTAVDLRLDWHRKLAPGFYFGPLQRHVATAAASYLIAEIATPER